MEEGSAHSGTLHLSGWLRMAVISQVIGPFKFLNDNVAVCRYGIRTVKLNEEGLF